MVFNPIPGGLQFLLCFPYTSLVLYQSLVLITHFPGEWQDLRPQADHVSVFMKHLIFEKASN